MKDEELDQWLAVEVMGYDVIEMGGHDHLWNPTSDLNQAMMCVEKLLSKKLTFQWDGKKRTLTDFRMHVCLGGTAWEAILSEYNDYDTDCDFAWGVDKSPSLAICKAIKEAAE